MAEARSPFSLLDEVEAAQEVLILTYTATLDFFERFALSHARALGALVTVVSDAAMVSGDPVLVRRAGTAYLDARAVAPGAFHPKLVVVVGEDETRVAIGSGNLTTAGWHGSAEMWTVLRADGDAGPTTLQEVAAFLRALPDSNIALTAGAGDACQRVAGLLEPFPSGDPGPRLLHSLTDPILGQLPAEPADELVLAAPFYDGRLAAVAALLKRFTPRRLLACVQHQTSVDGQALARLLGDHGGELGWIEDERYHHGKLIEWSANGRRLALTGSPNISMPALLRSVASGGNCELALLSQITETRAPAYTDVPLAEAHQLSHSPRIEEEEQPQTLLLGAFLTPSGVELVLHRRLRADGRLQRYDRAGDRWRTAATLDQGLERYLVEHAAAPAGSAVRVAFEDGTHSIQVFVTDLSRVRRPQASSFGWVRSDPVTVAEYGLGPELLKDLDELRPHLIRYGALKPIQEKGDEDGSEEDGEVVRARPAPGQSLEDYVAACDPILGQEMTEFALVLPALPGMEGDLGETFGVLEGDTEHPSESPETEGIEDEPEAPPKTLVETLLGQTEDERDRYRRWVERLVERSPAYPMIVRTLALRTVLHGVASHLWPERSWEEQVLASLEALGAAGDEPTEAELEAAGSLAALGLALLRLQIPHISIRDERVLRYEQITKAIGDLLGYCDPDRIQRLAPEMPAVIADGGALPAAEWVIDELTAAPSGPERAVRLLDEEHRLDAHLDGDGVLVLDDPLPGQVEPRLMLAVGLANDDGPLVIRGRTSSGQEVTAIWRRPDFAVARRTSHVWGTLYRIPDRINPLVYADLDVDRPAVVARWGMGEAPTATVQGLLALADRGRELRFPTG